MKNYSAILGVALAIMVPIGVAHASAISPAVQYTGTGLDSDTRPFTLGYQFTLSSSVTVNALGAWDDSQGFNHEVGIWNSSGSLLASVDVLPTDTLVDNFLWASIGNLTLGAGQYTIGAQVYDGGAGYDFPSSTSGITTIPQYTWVTDVQTYGPGLNLPTFSTGGGYGTNGILSANFSVGSVPEASTWAMMLAGFAGLSFAGYRASRKSVAFTG